MEKENDVAAKIIICQMEANNEWDAKVEAARTYIKNLHNNVLIFCTTTNLTALYSKPQADGF